MADTLSYYDVLRWREDQIAKFYIDNRDQSFPMITVLAFICLPVIGLMVSGSRTLRLAIFAIIAYLGIHLICNLRLIYYNGHYIGLIAYTWILHVAVLLLLSSPERDFQRLEYTRRPVDSRKALRLHNGHYIHWQRYLDAPLHRLNWVLSLLLSMRGSEWNWRIDSLRGLPAPL
ncbi:hypothetical protein N7522_004069 [Penicillium canescens]|nr:hypothetical protein N7522_004069 [Penicillium canescens]